MSMQREQEKGSASGPRSQRVRIHGGNGTNLDIRKRARPVRAGDSSRSGASDMHPGRNASLPGQCFFAAASRRDFGYSVFCAIRYSLFGFFIGRNPDSSLNSASHCIHE